MRTSYIDVMFGKNIANAGNYSWLIVGVEKNHFAHIQFCLKVNFVDPDQPRLFFCKKCSVGNIFLAVALNYDGKERQVKSSCSPIFDSIILTSRLFRNRRCIDVVNPSICFESMLLTIPG